jgi:hypothetical protein
VEEGVREGERVEVAERGVVRGRPLIMGGSRLIFVFLGGSFSFLLFLKREAERGGGREV